MQELVGFAEVDHLLGEHFQHVAHHLERAPFTHAIRSDTALESGANLALQVNHDHGKDGIDRDDQSHQHTLRQDGKPFAHPARQQRVQPRCHDRKIKHKNVVVWLICCLLI